MDSLEREESLRRAMVEYGEVLDFDERKPGAAGSGNWQQLVEGGLATGGDDGAQFPNAFVYLDQAEGSGDFPPPYFNPDHLFNGGVSSDYLANLETLAIPNQAESAEAGALLRSASWRGIADNYVNANGDRIETPSGGNCLLPQWVRDLKIGPGNVIGGSTVKPSGGILLKGLGTPLPPSPRSIRAAFMDNRNDVSLSGNTWRGGGAQEWDFRRASAHVGGDAHVGGNENPANEGDEGAAAGTPLPWATSPYYPASTPNGRKALSPTNHSAAERRRRDRINDRYDIIRNLIPGTQKADKATVLKAVIEYVSRLQAAGADNLLQKEATDEQTASHSHHVQQQAALSEVYTPTLSGPGWQSEEEEASSLQDKVAVEIRDQSYVVRITCPTRSGLLFDVIAALKQLGLEVTDGELSSCRGRVLHVFYVPVRNVTKDVIKARLEVAVFPGRYPAVNSPLRPSTQPRFAKREAPVMPTEPPVQLHLPPNTQRRAGTQVGGSNKRRKSNTGQ